MRFRVNHLTRYCYSEPVRLGRHWLRLRPRSQDGVQLLYFDLDVAPAPAGRSEGLDPDGNLITAVWFAEATTRLQVRCQFEVVTGRINPYHYLADPAPWPVPYAPELSRRLTPWLAAEPAAPSVAALADELRAQSADASDFVHRLNARLHQQIKREIRDTGAPQRPEETLALGIGACRDLAVLFIAVCRLSGLAARFVSGYQKGRDDVPIDAAELGRRRRYMHAWPEVFLPGGGWCGFDPTHGLAVADRHVALAAAAHPDDAAPIEGSFFGGAQSTIETELAIDVDA